MYKYRLVEKTIVEGHRRVSSFEFVLKEWEAQTEDFGKEYIKRPEIHILWLRQPYEFDFEEGHDHEYRLERWSTADNKWELVGDLDKYKFIEGDNYPDDSIQ